MAASPLTIQAWFQAPAQYGCLPRRERGGGGGGKAAAVTAVVVVQRARLGVEGSESVIRDCVCVRAGVGIAARCLLLEVLPSRAAAVLSVERQDDISSLE